MIAILLVPHSPEEAVLGREKLTSPSRKERVDPTPNKGQQWLAPSSLTLTSDTRQFVRRGITRLTDYTDEYSPVSPQSLTLMPNVGEGKKQKGSGNCLPQALNYLLHE